MSNDTPDVSICITTHNHKDYILDCVMSVIMQSNDLSIEVIIGDDSSSDGTSDILRSLSEKHPEIINIINHHPRIGYGSLNLQKIVGLAQGKYIAHLDGDDFWLPGKLREQVSFLDKNQDCIAVCTNALCINALGNPIGVFNNTQRHTKFSTQDLITNGNFLNHSSLLYRSCFAQTLQNWDKPFIDYRIHLHLTQLGRIGYINKILTGYRVGSSSSAILHRGDLVRSLYWHAISEVSSEIVSESKKLEASADFLCKVFFRSVKTRSRNLFHEWWIITSESHPHQKLKLGSLTLANIIKYGVRLTWSIFASKLSGTNLRVFYWH